MPGLLAGFAVTTPRNCRYSIETWSVPGISGEKTMKKRLPALALLVSLAAPAGAAPIVTLGPPVSDSFLTVDPGSIRVDALSAGDVVDLQLSITIDPICIRPIDIGLRATGDGGVLTDQTGVVINPCDSSHCWAASRQRRPKRSYRKTAFGRCRHPGAISATKVATRRTCNS